MTVVTIRNSYLIGTYTISRLGREGVFSGELMKAIIAYSLDISCEPHELDAYTTIMTKPAIILR